MSPRAGSSTVYVGQIDHQYVRRTVDILRHRYPNLTIEPTGGLWQPSRTAGRVVLHLQWIDPALGQSSPFGAAKSAFLLSFYVIALRLTGVRTVWTIHNPVGKGHNRRTLDRVLRTALAATCSQFVVLNAGAATVTEADLYPPVRRRFRRRVHTVPMPMTINTHGVEMSTGEARTRLGINSTMKPVLTYLTGHNHPDRSGDLRDPMGRYELISLQRDGHGDIAPGLHRVSGGWEFRGRPSDEEYGLLVSSGDAVVLAADRAFGSLTLHNAVELRRPVISLACPAAEELAVLGGAIQIEGDVSSDKIAAAWEQIDLESAHTAFEVFERRHNDTHVANALGGAYQAAGLELGEPVMQNSQAEGDTPYG